MRPSDACGSPESHRIALSVSKVDSEAAEEIRDAIRWAQWSGPHWRLGGRRLRIGAKGGRGIGAGPKVDSKPERPWPANRVRGCEIVHIRGQVPLAFLDWFEAFVHGAEEELRMLGLCSFEMDVSR